MENNQGQPFFESCRSIKNFVKENEKLVCITPQYKTQSSDCQGAAGPVRGGSLLQRTERKRSHVSCDAWRHATSCANAAEEVTLKSGLSTTGEVGKDSLMPANHLI